MKLQQKGEGGGLAGLTIYDDTRSKTKLGTAANICFAAAAASRVSCEHNNSCAWIPLKLGSIGCLKAALIPDEIVSFYFMITISVG